MTDYRAKIAKAEENATMIVEHLVKLKDEAEGFRSATDTLENVTLKIDSLINELKEIAQAQREQTIAIKEIDTHNLMLKLDNSSTGLLKKATEIKRIIIGEFLIVLVGIIIGFFL